MKRAAQMMVIVCLAAFPNLTSAVIVNINANTNVPPQAWAAGDDVRIASSSGATATVNVNNVAALDTNGGLSLGRDFTNTNGTLIADGASATLTQTGGSITIGHRGSGTLTLQNGATGNFSGRILSVGNLSFGTTLTTGNLNVLGTNSAITASGQLLLSRQGSQGIANITGGGEIDTGLVRIGSSAAATAVGGSTGFFTVDGSGSLLDISQSGGFSLFVGSDAGGPGTLTLTDGGKVEAEGSVTVEELGTLEFGIGGGALLSTTAAATIDDGTTVKILALEPGYAGGFVTILDAGTSLTVDLGQVTLDLTSLGDVTGSLQVVGNDLQVQVLLPVPEPSTLMLLSLAGCAIMARGRRRTGRRVNMV